MITNSPNSILDQMTLGFLARFRSTGDPQRPNRIAITETLRFLWLLSLGHSSAARLISHQVDDIWHIMILNTRYYDELCTILPGRHFLHHEPGQAPSEPSEEQISRCFVAIAEYVCLFGEFTDESLAYWPAVKELAETFGISLDEFNKRVVFFRRPHAVAKASFDAVPIRFHSFSGGSI